jgi:hypothetical protein
VSIYSAVPIITSDFSVQRNLVIESPIQIGEIPHPFFYYPWDVFESSTEAYYIGNQDLDYAVVSDFDPNFDILQLSGSLNDYRIEVTVMSENQTSVTQIYQLKAEGEDLIATLQNTSSLSLEESYFNFI